MAGLTVCGLLGLAVAADAGSGALYVLGLVQAGVSFLLIVRIAGAVPVGEPVGPGWPATRRGNLLAMVLFAALAIAGAVLAALTEAYWPGLALAGVFAAGVFRAIGGYFDAPPSAPVPPESAG
ncbi:MAG: hypothetical protein H6843_06015 [Rhodospirillaceae bacterium]|nr:hypothetical protein [Rhodospirillaceae bacterium]